MKKPRLIINKRDLYSGWVAALGLSELLSYLVKSDLFDVSYHNEIINTLRGEKGAVLYYNNKKIYFDVWEYSSPTYSNEVYNANFDLIIKLQHSCPSPENFEKACLKKKVLIDKTPEQRRSFFNKIIPWTFFCSRMFTPFIDKEEKIIIPSIERLAFFCGKGWKCRKPMRLKLQKDDIEYISSSQEIFKAITDKEYFQRMINSKFGLVIHGRGSYFTESKNRREIDYMMLKKPLLLNYKPHYYNPLIEGTHYIYIDQKTDIKNIENLYNINEIAENGWQWYKNNASPSGVAKSFLQIMSEKFT